MHEVNMKHHCRLPENMAKPMLPPLHPRAYFHEKLSRKIKEFIILDIQNRKCNEFFCGLQSPMRNELKRHAKSLYSFIIHPFSKLNFVLEVLFFIVWIWRYAITPILHSVLNHERHKLKILNYSVNILQVILTTFAFFTGYADYNTKKIYISCKEIALHYLKTYFFFDFMTMVHSYMIHGTYSNQMWQRNVFVFICSLALISYLVRLRTILNTLKNLLIFSNTGKACSFVIQHVFQVSIIIHSYTCSVYALSKWFHSDSTPEGSLIQLVEERSSNSLSLYLECSILVICYFFGASHPFVASDPLEQLLLFLVTFTGRIYTLFMIAEMLQVFGQINTSETEYEQRLIELKGLMQSKNLPTRLQNKLIGFYEAKYIRNHFNEHDIFLDLDDFMRTELIVYSARGLIKNIDVFTMLSKSQLVELITHMERKTFLTNDLICRRGSKVTRIFFISHGTVAVLNKDYQEICHIEDGDYFGLISYWTSHNFVHIYSHLAVESCEIYTLSVKNFEEFLRKYPEALKYFENKVRERVKKYRQLSKTILKGGTDLFSALRSGTLLEKPKMRPFVRE